MTFDTVITDSHVILPSGVAEKNIVIDEGRIVKFTTEVPQCNSQIKARGLVSIPGVIDPHVHYGVYSSIEKAAITESRAAAIGGVTTMMRMLRLSGSYKELLDLHLSESSTTHYIDYAIHASILQQNQIDEMEYCTKKGISSFKLYMNLGDDVGHIYMDMIPGTNSLHEEKVKIDLDMIMKIVHIAASLNCPILVHAEDYQMCSCGMKEGREKKKDGLGAWSESRSVESEIKSIRTISQIARKAGCVLYFVHIGSQGAINAINVEKKKGTKIFVETCPHYLTLSYESQKGYLAKVMPPIRTSKDMESIWREIHLGSFDSIGTDHVANRLDLKLGGNFVWDALAGFPGIGTMLPILISEGVNKGRMSLEQLVLLTSLNSARIFGMFPKKGSFQKDSDADITIIDMKKEVKVSSQLLDGFSDYSVYEGWNLKGWPVKTIVRGQVIAEDFKLTGKPGYGKFVKRPVLV